jgi:osmotically-inducible protein OsmY
VLAALRSDPQVVSGEIGVAVKEGIVTLSGLVPGYGEKDAAEEVAKRVPGVRAVANEIEVRMFWKRTDPEIAREVVHTLDRSVEIPSDAIKVTVEEGVVTLEGTVDSPSQRTLAESMVKDLKGVIGVNNLIKVRQTAPPK